MTITKIEIRTQYGASSRSGDDGAGKAGGVIATAERVPRSKSDADAAGALFRNAQGAIQHSGAASFQTDLFHET